MAVALGLGIAAVAVLEIAAVGTAMLEIAVVVTAVLEIVVGDRREHLDHSRLLWALDARQR